MKNPSIIPNPSYIKVLLEFTKVATGKRIPDIWKLTDRIKRLKRGIIRNCRLDTAKIKD